VSDMLTPLHRSGVLAPYPHLPQGLLPHFEDMFEFSNVRPSSDRQTNGSGSRLKNADPSMINFSSPSSSSSSPSLLSENEEKIDNELMLTTVEAKAEEVLVPIIESWVTSIADSSDPTVRNKTTRRHGKHLGGRTVDQNHHGNEETADDVTINDSNSATTTGSRQQGLNIYEKRGGAKSSYKRKNRADISRSSDDHSTPTSMRFHLQQVGIAPRKPHG
jgi:hypothetical protein